MGDVSQDTFAFLSLISRSLHVWRISFYFLIIKKDKNSPTALPWEHAENKMPEPHVHPGVGVDVGENVLTQLIKKQTEPEPHIVQKNPGLVVGRLATLQALSDSQGHPISWTCSLHPCQCVFPSSWAFGTEGRQSWLILFSDRPTDTLCVNSEHLHRWNWNLLLSYLLASHIYFSVFSSP